MNCPRCATTTLDDEDACSKCGGAWLAEQAVRERAAKALEISNPLLSDIGCPACSQRMVEIKIFDVTVDKCAEHGIWFDREELDEVIHRSKSDEWRLYGGVNRIGHDIISAPWFSSLGVWIEKLRRKPSA